MDREIRITGDGSHTVFVNQLEEPYHSIHGALQESAHVFINQGFMSLNQLEVRILELGFGTGLNALLTLSESLKSHQQVYYHTVEKYPLSGEEYRKINFEEYVQDAPEGSFLNLHRTSWGENVAITPRFTLFKELSDFRAMNPPDGIHLVYFDAFDPNKQPYLWTEEIFRRISKVTAPGGILVTYSAKGSVRRALKASGFEVRKVPGPPGKREMIRAIKA
jgi:tRNA U34 5-methylaminomethyl-2-thiouridine-forming methyltransferase MnmC